SHADRRRGGRFERGRVLRKEPHRHSDSRRALPAWREETCEGCNSRCEPRVPLMEPDFVEGKGENTQEGCRADGREEVRHRGCYNVRGWKEQDRGPRRSLGVDGRDKGVREIDGRK